MSETFQVQQCQKWVGAIMIFEQEYYALNSPTDS